MEKSTLEEKTTRYYNEAKTHIAKHKYQQAIKLLQKAANNNHAKSYYHLGVLYIESKGVAKTEQYYNQGLQYLSKAKQLGCDKAKSYLDNLNLSDELRQKLNIIDTNQINLLI